MSSDKSASRGEREWDVVRRQVALCGRVSRGDAPVLDADVRIEPWTAPRPPDAYTRPDGIYFFLDLPAGEYTVTAHAGANTGHGSGTVSRDARDKEKVRAAVVDIEVTPQNSTRGSESHRNHPGRGRRARSV